MRHDNLMDSDFLSLNEESKDLRRETEGSTPSPFVR